MRRFITSLFGKTIGNLVIAAMVLPSLAIALSSKAEAQVTVAPSWAVVEFENLKSPGTNFGKVAADAVANELMKTNQYEVQSAETIDRAAKAIGITLPAAGGTTNLFRLADELRVSTIVTGQIAAYSVSNTGAGKQARVTIRTVVYDVPSQTAINGAVVTADSTQRGGTVDDATLIADAIQQASRNTVRDIQSKSLPFGTVLNTTTSAAFINKGARAGFKDGQEVIILRGKQQVGIGRVYDTEPDGATVRVERGVGCGRSAWR